MGEGKKYWRYIEEDGVTASYGLATDEFLMSYGLTDDAKYPVSLKLYTYRDHCALAGRFQDIRAEIDTANCEEAGIGYSRRLTGGGAIIMGKDQLGICLTASGKYFQWEHVRELYHLFSKPVISALQEMGINAQFRSKNDLEVNGKKIAGLGVHISPENTLQFHTSLLIDLDTSAMLKILKIPIQKFSDKRMTASIEQRLTTIRRETGRTVTLEVVRQTIKKHFEAFFEVSMDHVPVDDAEKKAIRKLEKKRYLDPAWVFQYSPQEDMTGMGLKKTKAGLLRTYIGLKGETIKSVLITGDFFEQAEVFSRIESDLKWGALEKEKISEVVKRIMDEYDTGNIYGVSAAEITEAVWLAAQRALAANRYTYKGSCYYPKTEKEGAAL